MARRFKSSGVYAPAGDGSGAQIGSEDIIVTLVKYIWIVSTRHRVGVQAQDLLAPSGDKGRTLFQMLLAHLPDEHKTKWFAGAALNSAEQVHGEP
ncbi:hypothetical protein [Sinanaerobacter chloroacetimidivorans]|uniref:hypothetical protein n=1 Tax=Sinanaerobacter chloroacetimidivorans TaxID=2818044 RepID=UPI001D04A12D|nr:hypothetical protein [Sinanaerobacter chloroacetimidivorans]